MSPVETSVSTRQRRHSLALTVGLVLVGINLAVAVLTLLWTPYDPLNASGGRLEAPSLLHWLGTDRLGRDLLTQLMIGARTALLVGTGAVAIGATIGVSLGVLAAFATRLADDVMAATLDILIAFPTLLLAMLVVAASDSAGLWTAILALGLAISAIVARLTRILAKRVLRQDYIIASRTSGTKIVASTTPRIPIGTLMKKIHRQEKKVTIKPPMGGPRIGPSSAGTVR